MSPTDIRKVCYPLVDLYVKSLYLNLIRWRKREVHEAFKEGAQAMEV
jgi:hypothetical protein